MASDRFTPVLLAWVAAVFGTVAVLGTALATPGLAATRVLAGALVGGAVVGLWRHVARTNQLLAALVASVASGNGGARFAAPKGAAFDALCRALNDAVRRLHDERERSRADGRFLEALVDDTAVALLTVDARYGVRLANKAARRLFPGRDGTPPESFAECGVVFAARLGESGPTREVLILRVDGRPQRALVRVGALDRFDQAVRVVTVEPIGGTLDAVEMAAQTDLVRVLTHEILNSLTPVTSLSALAARALGEAPEDLPTARDAVATLAARAGSLSRFIAAYREVARTPCPRPRSLAVLPFAAKMAALVRADGPTP